jgi:hypothetical protein
MAFQWGSPPPNRARKEPDDAGFPWGRELGRSRLTPLAFLMPGQKTYPIEAARLRETPLSGPRFQGFRQTYIETADCYKSREIPEGELRAIEENLLVQIEPTMTAAGGQYNGEMFAPFEASVPIWTRTSGASLSERNGCKANARQRGGSKRAL